MLQIYSWMRAWWCSQLSYRHFGRIERRCERWSTEMAMAMAMGDKNDDSNSNSNSNEFIEVYCSADLSTCEGRDTKGLYAKARAGVIPQFTGVSSPYEAPENAELNVLTGSRTLEECVGDVIAYLEKKEIIISSSSSSSGPSPSPSPSPKAVSSS
eukprot:475725_1